MKNQKNNDEWDELKNTLRKKYSQHMHQEGAEEELLGRLRKKTGETHNEIRNIIATLK